MKLRIFFLLKYYLFWLLFSGVARVIFLFYQFPESASLTARDCGMIFLKGFRMDLSLGGYVMMLACILMAVGVFLSVRLLKRLFSGLTFGLLVVCGLVVAGDLELFKNWGYHMDATPLLYLKTPGDALASTPAWLLVVLCGVWWGLVLLFFWIYRRWVANSWLQERRWRRKSGVHALVYLLLGGAMLLPVRGGFNVAPMNVSFVFFHPKNMFANQAAVNPVWNFLYEVMHTGELENEFAFLPANRARKLVDSLCVQRDTAPAVLAVSRPNVVVLLLETFTMNAWDQMPNLRAVAREGIFFSNIYATGNRSDRGMLGVISAFPAHPKASMLKYPKKTYNLPRFPTYFERAGYATRFYYAGDLNFGGFRSYVTMSFRESVTEDDFSGEAIEQRFKWGVHDEYMLRRLSEDLRKAPRPFCYMAFTMSSHEPFVVPMNTKVPGEDNGSKLRNAIAYTDACLGDFFRECKASGVWDSTLFVLVADHGTRHVGNLPPFSPESFRVPMIFTGGAMSVRDSVVTTLGSQIDLVATLFAQLGWDASAFRFSRNLLAPSVVPFAFYAYSNAAAVVSDSGAYVLDLHSLRSLTGDQSLRADSLVKAYLQQVDAAFREQ